MGKSYNLKDMNGSGLDFDYCAGTHEVPAGTQGETCGNFPLKSFNLACDLFLK